MDSTHTRRALCAVVTCLLTAVMTLGLVTTLAWAAPVAQPTHQVTQVGASWHNAGAITNDVLDGVTVRIRPQNVTSALSVNRDGSGIRNAVHLWELGSSARLYLQKVSDNEHAYQITFFKEFYSKDHETAKFEPDVDVDLFGHDNWSVDGATVHVVNLSTSNHGYWEIIPVGNGLFQFMSKISCKYLRMNDENGNGVWDNGDHLVQDDRSRAMNFEMEIINPGSRDLATTKGYSSYTFDHNGTSVSAANWMSALPDDTPITDLNIPGTHDTGTCSLMDLAQWNPLNGILDLHPIQDAEMASAQCQQLFYDDQLRCGVRCFDLRCNHNIKDGAGLFHTDEWSPALNHTFYCTDRDGSPLSMNDLWDQTCQFWSASVSSKETIVWAVSEQELVDTVNTQNIYDYFEKLVNANPERFYIGDHVPTLGEARGKIVILSKLSPKNLSSKSTYDYSGSGVTGKWALDITTTEKGVDFTTAGDTVLVRQGDNYEVWIEDDYKTNAETKWSRSTYPALNKAHTHRDNAIGKGKYAWNIIYTSASAMGNDNTTPINAAKYTNHRVKSYFDASLSNTPSATAMDGKYAGVVFMDFVDEQQCQYVYRQNFNMQMPKTAGEKSGKGTVDDPYIIHNANEWLTFASTVNAGNFHFCAKLANDVEGVTSMAGTISAPFMGTFDGDGHTLSVDITSDEDGTAPFHYICSATIKNLTVKGWVHGGDHSSGLVGFMLDNSDNLIEDVTVNTSVRTTGKYSGGIIGNSRRSATTMRRCMFNGYMEGGEQSGMLWGWAEDGGSVTIVDCFAKGSYTGTGNMSPVGLIDVTPAPIVRNVFYTTFAEQKPEQDGTLFGDCVSGIFFPSTSIHRKVEDYQGKTYYVLGSLENLQRSYTYTGSPIDLGFEVQQYTGNDNEVKLMTRDVEYTVQITDENGTTVDDSNVVAPGTYTLEISGNPDAGYAGTIRSTFTVTAPAGSYQQTSVVAGGRSVTGYGTRGWSYSDDGTDATAGTTEATWSRYGGANRYETMSAIVSAGFTESEWAVLATGASFPDALSASSLASVRNCPVLLTDASSLSPQARNQLERLGTRNVYVMGGTSSVSTSVTDELASMGIGVHRIAGDDRASTSVAAFRETRAQDARSDTVVIATGDVFADALSIGSWSYATASPILLCRGGMLSEEAADAIRADGRIRRVVIAGGAAAVSDGVMSQLGDQLQYVRLAGADRFETSSIIADWAISNGLKDTYVCVATGANFPDALAGAALAGRKGAPVLLESGNGSARRWLAKRASDLVGGFVFGGEAAVSADVLAALMR